MDDLPAVPGLPVLPGGLPDWPGLPGGAPPSDGSGPADTTSPGAPRPGAEPEQRDERTGADGTTFPTVTDSRAAAAVAPAAHAASRPNTPAPASGPFRSGGLPGGPLVSATTEAGSARQADAQTGCALFSGGATAALTRGALAPEQGGPVRDRHRDILEFPG
ncbi:hypothetical protein HUT18_22315 [Streptomyces sp. NA04227]|uniref:hypothetical protein n=1 Tax=Streptomyces sp. NA04227 TaxID=2742136 RepID=UPI0015920462|nr:hypothetical protein [Streptomyces sp. NA04227]QKW08700.1 hypothetical protein HUT18_22315 [Streptomyces sp. NA04227]